MDTKKKLLTVAMTAVLAGPLMATPIAMASNMGQSIEEQADITNWVANSPQHISDNMAMQHIDRNNLNGTRYVIQWGDTLWGISQATGISVAKLCYDNHIKNANLIYAGDILILNRNGSVPSDYHPNVNPYVVAQTKKTINNDVKNVNIVVSPKITINQNQDNSDNSTNNYSANSNSKAPAESDDDSQPASQSNKSSNKSTKTSSTNDDASQKLADKLSKAADKNDIDLNFEKYDPEADQDVKEVDFDDDAKVLNKAINKKQYKKAVKLIKSHLNDKDQTVMVEIKDGEVHVYVKHHDSSKDDSSSSSSQSSSSSSSNSQSDTNDSDSEEDDD